MASSTANNSTTDLKSVEQWATQCVSSWTRVDRTGDTMGRSLARRVMKDCLGQLQAIADDAETAEACDANGDEANSDANGDEETPVCSKQTTQPTPMSVWIDAMFPHLARQRPLLQQQTQPQTQPQTQTTTDLLDLDIVAPEESKSCGPWALEDAARQQLMESTEKHVMASVLPLVEDLRRELDALKTELASRDQDQDQVVVIHNRPARLFGGREGDAKYVPLNTLCASYATFGTAVYHKNTKRLCCSILYAEMFNLPFLEHIRFTGPIRIDGTFEHTFPRVNTVEMVWNDTRTSLLIKCDFHAYNRGNDYRYIYGEYEAMCAADGRSTGLFLFPALKHLTITVNDCGGPADDPYRDTRVAVHIVEAMQICNCRPDTLVIRRARDFIPRLDPIRNHCERNNIAWTETVA